jgi:signal transduction histidine kinase
MKLRSHLIALVLASLLPAILFAGVIIYSSYRQQRATIEAGMVDTARALSLAVDRELQASIRTLQALANLEDFTSGQFGRFYRFAQDAIKGIPGSQSMALMDPSGHQILNLRVPFGTKLPPAAAPDLIKKIIVSKQPAVSNLFQSPMTDTPLIVVGVPVVRHGQVQYVLEVSTSPAFLAALLSQQKIPPDWTGMIVDSNKIIIARTRDPERFIGQRATPEFAVESTSAGEGWFRGMSKEGIPVYTAFSRSQLSGWTVALGVPAARVEAPLRRTLIYMGVGGLLLLAGGIVMAATFGYRIARSAAQLSAGARALGRGETLPIQAHPVMELEEVAHEIETAAVNRQQAEQELRKSRGQLRALAAYLESVREQERTRIARELHDEIGQALTGIKLSLERTLRERSNITSLEPAVALTNELIGRVRDLSLELRPAMLDDLGLLAALTWHFNRYTTQVNVNVNFQHSGLDGKRFAPEIETAAYRIVQEALTNVARHARVDKVEVDIRADEKMLRIRIRDQGTGFVLDSLSPHSTGGLSGMRERAIMLAGRLEIESTPGVGTLLKAELPLSARFAGGTERAHR